FIQICGRYEGVDERVAQHLATDEISIGDFVLSGGELPAALLLDSITRLLPGALGNEASAVNESFAEEEAVRAREASVVDTSFGYAKHRTRVTNRGILDFPHYTRPQEFRGWPVPEVLVGGNHEQIRRWRRAKAIEKTLRNRPDLLDEASLSLEDARLLDLVRNPQS
ncbi:MAG: tRNA (guanosine(37)-N1)-methyltransferase TrmD, partial [Candidatus Acidiferrales bacterium]